jgi:hypothetical protein
MKRASAPGRAAGISATCSGGDERVTVRMPTPLLRLTECRLIQSHGREAQRSSVEDSKVLPPM